MSFEFGLKNLFRRWKQSFSYIVTIAILTAISVFFIYLGNGLGFTFIKTTPRFNVTTMELFSQYYMFIIISSIVIAIIWIIVVNHSLIHHKTNDIAIMKAVGAIQKKLRSHFFAVVLVIDIIGIVLGLIAGFILYIIFFFILSALGFDIVIHIDYIFVPILIIGIIIGVFFVNGYELWKISTKNYAQIALGDIPRNTDTQFRDFKPKKRVGLRVKLALRNLTRKRKSFYRMLLTTGITLSIIVTLTTSVFIISSTSIKSIDGAQGEDTLIIGHRDVVDHYIQRYEEFSNPEIQFTNTENLTKSTYLMNESTIDTIFNSSAYNEVTFWDKRLFVYEFGIEMKGLIITIEDGVASYQEVGSDRTGYVPVLGLEFQGEYTSQWQVLGTLDNASNSALVGDTLASEMFEAAIYQKIRLLNVTTSEYNITGVFYDSFCAGNATYVQLNALQQDYNLEDSINLAIVGISSSAEKETLITDIQAEINSTLGTEFVVRDLTPTFENNIRSLYPFVVISAIVIIIETLVIIASLFLYQIGNFQERAPDFTIIKVVGGTGKLIKSVVFLEDLAIILIASSISIGVSLVFNGVLLYADAILPPIWGILLLWIIITMVVIALVRISIYFLYKELDKIQQEILKDFSRAK
ncbi:MAG: FtsX-like permease family protein [Promethearchaeota archaeon]